MSVVYIHIYILLNYLWAFVYLLVKKFGRIYVHKTFFEIQLYSYFIGVIDYEFWYSVQIRVQI